MAGSFAFRLTCYQDFGWTPRQVHEALRDYPTECRLLAVYFEEQSNYHAEERRKQERQSTPEYGDGWRDEDTIGGDDEEDWFESGDDPGE